MLPFLWSCQQKTESVFPQKLNLIGEEIQVEVFVEPGTMEIHDNLLLLRRDYDAETYPSYELHYLRGDFRSTSEDPDFEEGD